MLYRHRTLCKRPWKCLLISPLLYGLIKFIIVFISFFSLVIYHSLRNWIRHVFFSSKVYRWAVKAHCRKSYSPTSRLGRDWLRNVRFGVRMWLLRSESRQIGAGCIIRLRTSVAAAQHGVVYRNLRTWSRPCTRAHQCDAKSSGREYPRRNYICVTWKYIVAPPPTATTTTSTRVARSNRSLAILRSTFQSLAGPTVPVNDSRRRIIHLLPCLLFFFYCCIGPHLNFPSFFCQVSNKYRSIFHFKYRTCTLA